MKLFQPYLLALNVVGCSASGAVLLGYIPLGAMPMWFHWFVAALCGLAVLLRVTVIILDRVRPRRA